MVCIKYLKDKKREIGVECQMLISLVIPTIGRKKELDMLLLSIKEQNYKKINLE